MTVLLVGSETGQHVRIEVLRRSHPNAINFDDGNWLEADLDVAVQGFVARVRASLRAEELEPWRAGLVPLERAAAGEAAFHTMEDWISLRFVGNGRGQIEVFGEMVNDPGGNNELRFQFEIDKTFLPPLLRQIEVTQLAYPVIGGPAA